MSDNTPQHSPGNYLNDCIGCGKVKTPDPDEICAACSNKGIRAQHSPMGDELQQIAFILYQENYEKLGINRQSDVHTIVAHIAKYYVPREQVARDMAEVIGDDETLRQQSAYDLEDVLHKETDRSVHGEMLYTVRQASRNGMRYKQRQRAQAKGYDIKHTETEE